MSEATRLLEAIGSGDQHAAAELLPLVYKELRRLARSQMHHERSEHTLQATALVHEVYLRLFQGQPQHWDGRRHFFAAAAEAMRRILIDHARRKQSLKLGGSRKRVQMEDDALPDIAAPCDGVEDLLALSQALDRLASLAPDKAELVKLLYFAGLNLEDAATMLGLSRTSAHRHWVFARAWLFDEMTGVKRKSESLE